MKLTIEKVIYGGQGLARIAAESDPRDGMRVFVPFTLPGEIVDTAIREERRGYLVADALEIERASEFRITPSCPWFGSCGGCQLQHGMYPYQVELKRAMLAESLTRAGIHEMPEISSLTGNPFGYRNRIRLQVQMQPDFAIGYHQTKTHRIVAIDHCPIATPVLEQCIAVTRALGLQGWAPAGLQEMEIFTNEVQSEVLMSLWTRPSVRFEKKPYEKFLENVAKKIPQMTGAAVFATEKTQTSTTRRLLQSGRQSLQYRVAGRAYTVGLGSFFQVNSTLLDAFVSAVVNGQQGECAWDLYAGVGLFTLALAERFQRVVAVESTPSASRDLRQNLQGKKSAKAVSSTTLNFLQQALQQREPAPDLALLDPPRAGVGLEACKLLARCNPTHIVYVSCDPATLGRDMGALIQSGYHLEQLQLVDMFPQTHHLETIAMLTR